MGLLRILKNNTKENKAALNKSRLVQLHIRLNKTKAPGRENLGAFCQPYRFKSMSWHRANPKKNTVSDTDTIGGDDGS